MRAEFIASSHGEITERLDGTCDGSRRRVEEKGVLSLVCDGLTVTLRDPDSGHVISEPAANVYRYGLLEAMLNPSRLDPIDDPAHKWHPAHPPKSVSSEGRPAWHIVMLSTIGQPPLELIVDDATGVVIKLIAGGRTAELRNLTAVSELPDSIWTWPEDDLTATGRRGNT